MLFRFSIAGFLALVALMPIARGEEFISVRGSQVAAEPVTAAADQIRKDVGLEFTVATEGGNGAAVNLIGEELLDVALLSRPITARERAIFADRDFVETQFGTQALLVVVPDQVWKSGVHALTKEQLRDIYEGKVTNWKALGGEDRKLVYYNRNITRSQWDLFMGFLYEEVRKAPLSEAEVLEAPSDVTAAVEFNLGSISILDYNVPRSERIHALGIKLPDGSVVEPTPANIASGRYELARPLLIATARKPAGKARKLLDFMLGPAGQEWVKKTGHIPNAELATGKQPDSGSR